MEYEIIATLGPSSAAPSVWLEMLSAGVTAFRLNTSHLSLDDLLSWLEDLSTCLAPYDPQPPIILDLQGSKWRLGEFPAGSLEPGQKIQLIYSSASDDRNELPVPHADFFQAAAQSDGNIILNDAKIRLTIESCSSAALAAVVVRGGELSARKGITLASSAYRQEKLSQKDQAIFAQTCDLGFIRYAISYVKDALEMAKYRANFGKSVYLIAKLERGPAIDEARQIAESTDELWLCRGDLGAELGLKPMAEVVARFSNQITRFGAPVMLAGQVLEHMKEASTPTRSEVSYLYEALLKGYRGVVLSDETAVGRYPIESCQAAALFRD